MAIVLGYFLVRIQVGTSVPIARLVRAIRERVFLQKVFAREREVLVAYKTVTSSP